MRGGLLFAGLVLAAGAWAQGAQSGHVDLSLPPLPAGSSDSVTFAVLDGSTAPQITFLQALAAAPRKATFICQNLANQSFPKQSVHGLTSQTIGIDHTGSNWPYVATVVGCGTVTLRERWNYGGGNYSQEAEDRYQAGFWGTVEIQPQLKTEGSIGGLGFVDYCPQAGLLSPAGCETSARRPAPPPPEFTARIGVSVWYGLPNDVLGGQDISWGSRGIRLAFVPDSDRSEAANALRSSSADRGNVCDEMDEAAADPAIVFAKTENISHSEVQERASITMTVGHVTPPRLEGELFACSGPLHLRWTTTTYDGGLSFTHTHTNDHYAIWWYGRRVSLRPNGFDSVQFGR